MYEQIARNKRLSVVYIGVFFLLWMAIGALVGLVAYRLSSGSGGTYREPTGVGSNPASEALTGALIALVLGVGATLVALRFGAQVVLQTAGARPADRVRDAQLINLVEALAIGEGLPMPSVHVIDDPSPNAFATGTRPAKAAITVTTGLLRMMNREELEGVLAHEMSHVKNFDVRLILIVSTLIGLAGVLSSVVFRTLFWTGRGRRRDTQQLVIILLVAAALLAIFAVLLGPVVKLALSRRRELLADTSGVELTRNPAGLLSALKKLQHVDEPFSKFNQATAAMCIIDPTQRPTSRPNWIARLYDTHPPLEERIAALEMLMIGHAGPGPELTPR